MGQPLRPQRITDEVEAMPDKFIEATLARLKDLYDSGVISEAFYYRTQCEIFRTIRNERPVQRARWIQRIRASIQRIRQSTSGSAVCLPPHYTSVEGKV